MIFNKTLLAALLSTLIPLQSFARDYHVEAIIFTNGTTLDTVAEQWDEKAPRNIRAQNKLDVLYQQAIEAAKAREEASLLDPPEAAIESETASISDVEKLINTQTSFELDELLEIQDSLEQSPEHEILQTLSWNQSEANYISSPLINILTPHMMGVIRVYAPNLLFAELNLTYVPDEVLEESLNAILDESVDTPEEIVLPDFDNRISSIGYGGEYIAPPVIEPVFPRYFIDEQRKLKLNEIHYFDPPRFGVILSVKPIENPAPESSSS